MQKKKKTLVYGQDTREEGDRSLLSEEEGQ